MWTLATSQQHAAPPKVKLWTKDTSSWFSLAESNFNQVDAADPGLCFDLILPALSEEVIEQIRGVLHAVDDIPDPYMALKACLLELFTPKPPDQCQK